ncbi:uncharacterized protein LOC111642638 [Centruroides sculpturatus]|uniref:uncharacterized protein LOC111642638 n=1 Tax=Centruroides sculpturatus TaxID=218467 RepID=UPI000C6EDEC3|nr:uncharacterized protein LOC111642638 [Centruroides sculpturatus]
MVTKKKYTQSSCKTSEKLEELKAWLAPDPTGDPLNAYCHYYKISLTAHKKGLLAHAKTRNHREKTALEKNAKSSKKLPFEPVIRTETKIAELKLSAFVAEHSSINTVNHLTELLPKIDEKSKIFGELKLHRTKCSMLLKNVFGASVIEELIQDMDNSPFSVIIYKSTDISTTKILCIMLENCDVDSIYNSFRNQLLQDGLNLHNLIGIGVDNASVIIEIHRSFSTLLRDDVPSLVVVRCVCHSLHLCAEKACQTLPRQLEYLVREAHN